jgi:cell division protein FtsN
MTHPRVKRIRPVAKRQRPERCARPTPEERARVMAEIRRRLGVPDPDTPTSPGPSDID